MYTCCIPPRQAGLWYEDGGREADTIKGVGGGGGVLVVGNSATHVSEWVGGESNHIVTSNRHTTPKLRGTNLKQHREAQRAPPCDGGT